MTQWHLISESNIIQSRPILTDKKRIGEEENSDIIVNASMLSPDHDLVENKLSLPSASCKMIWKFIAISHYYESNRVCDYVFCCSLISSQAEASTPGDMMVMKMSFPEEPSTPGDTLMVYLEWRHPAGAHPNASGDSPLSSLSMWFSSGTPMSPGATVTPSPGSGPRQSASWRIKCSGYLLNSFQGDR